MHWWKERQYRSYTVKPFIQLAFREIPRDGKGYIEVKNQGKGLIFTRMIMEGIPEEGNEEDFSNRMRLEVSYQRTDGKPLDIPQVLQGTDFYAFVTVI